MQLLCFFLPLSILLSSINADISLPTSSLTPLIAPSTSQSDHTTNTTILSAGEIRTLEISIAFFDSPTNLVTRTLHRTLWNLSRQYKRTPPYRHFKDFDRTLSDGFYLYMKRVAQAPASGRTSPKQMIKCDEAGRVLERLDETLSLEQRVGSVHFEVAVQGVTLALGRLWKPHQEEVRRERRSINRVGAKDNEEILSERQNTTDFVVTTVANTTTDGILATAPRRTLEVNFHFDGDPTTIVTQATLESLLRLSHSFRLRPASQPFRQFNGRIGDLRFFMKLRGTGAPGIGPPTTTDAARVIERLEEVLEHERVIGEVYFDVVIHGRTVISGSVAKYPGARMGESIDFPAAVTADTE